MAERKSFLLRLDTRLYEELRRWASAELRSVNAQIEFVLRRAANERRGGRGKRGLASEAGPEGKRPNET